MKCHKSAIHGCTLVVGTGLDRYWAGMGVWQKSIHVPCCQGAVLILVCFSLVYPLILVCFRFPDCVYPLN